MIKKNKNLYRLNNSGASAFRAQWTGSHTPESRENNNEHMLDMQPPYKN